MLRHIVYRAHGNRDSLNECCFSIASLQRFLMADADTQVHIFTDQKKYLQQFLTIPVIYHEINNEKIKEWRGSIDFIHRLKIKALLELCRQVGKGPILYLDTDIIAVQPLDMLWHKISQGQFLMHSCEGNIIDSQVPIFRKIKPVIEYAVESDIMTIGDFDMWNSGVVGFLAEQSNLLEEALTMTDALYLRKPKHVIEQMNFSYVFQRSGNLKAAEDVIYHYWNLKEFRLVLQQVYALPTVTRDELIDKLLKEDIVKELFAIKKDYYTHPLNRIRKSLFRIRWGIPSLEKLILDFKLA